MLNIKNLAFLLGGDANEGEVMAPVDIPQKSSSMKTIFIVLLAIIFIVVIIFLLSKKSNAPIPTTPGPPKPCVLSCNANIISSAYVKSELSAGDKMMLPTDIKKVDDKNCSFTAMFKSQSYKQVPVTMELAPIKECTQWQMVALNG